MKYEINIGDEAMDVVTGIKGIVVVRHDYLYGVPRVGIQPQGSFEGKAHETIHVDILQAELVKKAAVNRKETYATNTIPLGSKCKCKVTGYDGICTGKAEWLYACTKVLIQPQKTNPKTLMPLESNWFDEPGVELISDKTSLVEEAKSERTTGGFGKPVSGGGPFAGKPFSSGGRSGKEISAH